MEDLGDASAAGRAYKSRKARPCDACRRRKVTCVMPSGPPCRRCSGKTLSCTFEHGPGERKRPPPSLLPPASPLRRGGAPVSLSSSPPSHLPRAARYSTQLQPAMPPIWLDDPGFFPMAFGVAHDGPDRMETDAGGYPPLQDSADGMHHESFGFPATPTFAMMDSSRCEPPSLPLLPPPPPPPPPLLPPLQPSSFVTPTPRTPSSSGHPGSPDRPLGSPGSPGGTTSSRTGPVSVDQGHTTSGSLEFLPGAFSFYVGPTGVADIHLLSREPFGADGVTELSVKGLRYRRMQRARERPRLRRAGRRDPSGRPPAAGPDDTGTPPVIFGLTDHTLLEKAEPKPDAEATERAWVALWKILTPQTAWSLVRLYARFVDPYFPILSRHQMPQDPHGLSNMSLALLTAICATALPFVIHDRSLYALLLRPPSSEELYRLCWQGISQELHAPSLSTLQACLLLQQRLPTNLYLNDTAFAWSLVATAVSVAQTIGLHRDPSGWTAVPAWERRRRRRLWWALWTTEKWVALARGMPSHLDDDEADVEPMRLDDIHDTLSDPAAAQPHLYHLVRLTTILAEIQKTFYTVRATRQTRRNLALSLEVGRAARVRLKAWHDALPVELHSRNRREALSVQHATDDSRTGRGSGGNSGSGSGSGSAGGGGGDGGGVGDRSSDGSNGDSGEESRPRTGTDWGQQLDGHASLHLSYIVTHMTLFRALLRPLEADNGLDNSRCLKSDDRHGDRSHSHSHGNDGCRCSESGTQAVMRGALLCIREFVEFVEVLTPAQWNAFWHGWSRANFAMAGSFMVQLLHVVSTTPDAAAAARAAAADKNTAASPVDESAASCTDREMDGSGSDTRPIPRPWFADEYRELVGWIRRWRWASRVSATGAAGAKGLTNLGLLRVETFIGQLGGLEDV